MKPEQIITQLEANMAVFKALFENKSEEQYLWKPDEKSWSLLEILCHLHDEEREDFRTRVFHTLETPEKPPPPIDPQGWVTDRAYASQDYTHKLHSFLAERKNTVGVLNALKNPPWDNACTHRVFGPMTAYQYLVNWLAHDYHHIRQVNRRLYEFLQHDTGADLRYAGDWV